MCKTNVWKYIQLMMTMMVMKVSRTRTETETFSVTCRVTELDELPLTEAHLNSGPGQNWARTQG